MTELLADRHFGPSRLGYAVLAAAVGVVVALLAWSLAVDVSATRASSRVASPEAAVVSATIDRAQADWRERLEARGLHFEPAGIALFTDREPNACEPNADAASGAFYCPADGRVHVDLGLIRELENRFGAAGEIAADYAVLRAVGHRVQDQLGVLAQVGFSLRSELQADCYAGIAARGAPRLAALGPDEVAGAMRAAAAASDARIRSSRSGVVQPEGLAHGTLEQRARWFLRGYDTGLFDACDALTAVRL